MNPGKYQRTPSASRGLRSPPLSANLWIRQASYQVHEGSAIIGERVGVAFLPGIEPFGVFGQLRVRQFAFEVMDSVEGLMKQSQGNELCFDL